MAGNAGEGGAVLRIGADRVARRGERLVVRAAVEMPDWEVRRYGSTGIEFRGETWVTVALARDGHAAVYTLERWDRSKHDTPPSRITYDEAYVRARDRERHAAHAGGALWIAVVLLSPLLGLLPSSLKLRLNASVGLETRTATRRSILLEIGVVLLAGTFASVLGFASVAGGIFGGAGGVVMVGSVLEDPIVALVAIIAAVALDVLGRGNTLLRDDPDQPGFYEWLVRPLLRWGSRRR